MTTRDSNHINVDMMDDFTLFRMDQIAKQMAQLAPGKSPTLILTDPTGKKRLSFANFQQLQEIREHKAVIDAGKSEISLDIRPEDQTKPEAGDIGEKAPVEDEEKPTTEKPTEEKQEGKIRIRNEFHRHMYKFSESNAFSVFMLVVIITNCAILIAMTFEVVVVRGDWYFASADNIMLAIYTVEVVLRLYVWRKDFFKEGWYLLDFVIVIFGIFDFIMPLILENSNILQASSILKLLRILRAVRALRALRMLRTIKFLRSLQIITSTILSSMKSIGAIVILMVLFMYMFGVVGRSLYGDAHPRHFGTLWESIFTCFMLLTLDDWFDIYADVVKVDPSKAHIIIYLLSYIVVEYFIFLNLFVAVLVDNFQMSLVHASADTKQARQKAAESAEFEHFFADADLYGTDDDMSKMSDEIKLRKTMTELYPNMDPKDLKQLEHHMRLMCSIEHHCHNHFSYQRLLDGMVDMSTWQPPTL